MHTFNMAASPNCLSCGVVQSDSFCFRHLLHLNVEYAAELPCLWENRVESKLIGTYLMLIVAYSETRYTFSTYYSVIYHCLLIFLSEIEAKLLKLLV